MKFPLFSYLYFYLSKSCYFFSERYKQEVFHKLEQFLSDWDVVQCLFWWMVVFHRYKLGFCRNGPDCRYRHAKQPGPPPPVEEVLQKIQQLTSYNYGNTNRFLQNRNPNYSQQSEKSQFSQIPNGANQVAKPTTAESPALQQQQQQQQQGPPPQQISQAQAQNLPNGQQNQTNRMATPLPQGTSRCVQSNKVFY